MIVNSLVCWRVLEGHRYSEGWSTSDVETG